LVDTGATISFVSLNYLTKHKFKTTPSAAPTAVRLGNGDIHHCTEHVSIDMTVEGHDFNIKCLVMPLPPGIDSILGMDWMNENNIWLNPKTKRIIFGNEFGSDKNAFINATHILDTEIPHACNTTLKLEKGVVHACNMTNLGSDFQFVPTNLLNKMLLLLKEGTMSIEMCELMCLDVVSDTHTHTDTHTLSYANLCAINTQMLNPVTKQVILKERMRLKSLREKELAKTKHGSHVHGVPEPENLSFSSHKNTHKNTHKENGTLRQPETDRDHSGQVFIKSLIPKLNTIHKYSDFDDFYKDKTESVWLAHIAVLPDGTVYLDKNDPNSIINGPGNNVNDGSVPEPQTQPPIIKNNLVKSDNSRGHDKHGDCLEANNDTVDTINNNIKDYIDSDTVLQLDKKTVLETETEQQVQERWRQAVIHVLGLTQEYKIPTHQNKIQPELFNKAPENINKTVSKYQSWVDKFTNQEIEFFKCFEPLDKFVPLASDKPMKVTLKPGTKPPPIRRYKCPINLLPTFKNYITEMLDKGWIKPGKTEYTAPVLILKKPGTYEDGTSKGYRFVCDMRGINAIVETQQHYLPDITEMYEKLRDAEYISVCDVRHGFWNAPVSECSKKYLGMSTPFGETFVWNVVPQGFINSSAHFQDFLERKLRKHGVLYEPSVKFNPDIKTNDKVHKHTQKCDEKDFPHNKVNSSGLLGYTGYAACYQDDIIIFSKSASEHKTHLLSIMKILSEENIPLNAKKCNFFCKYCRYLGMVVGNKQIFMDPNKINSVTKMIVKKDIGSIRTFLGMCGFYRRFISNYGGIAKPLTDMTRKGIDIESEWSELQDCAVQQLKHALTTYPVLRQPDFNKPFTICSDASMYAMGAVLAQSDDDGKMYACSYVSRAFRGPEKNYSIQHKECLGCIYALKKFDHYISAAPHFELRMCTDHQSLQFLKNQSLLTGRMARWSMIFAERNCTIRYIKGKDNYVGDCLSRLLTTKIEDFDTTESLLILYNVNLNIVQSLFYADTNTACGGIDDLERCLLFKQLESEDFPEDAASISDKTMPFHERLMFGRYRTSACANLNISRNDYIKCNEFGLIYQALDPKLKDKISDKDLKTIKYRLKEFHLENELLYHISKSGETIAVPSVPSTKTLPCLRDRIISELHDNDIAGHRGVNATRNALRQRFYWPKMHIDVQNFINNCEVCDVNKSNRRAKPGFLQPLDKPFAPQSHYSLDFKTDLPESGRDRYNTLMVVVDRFSKRCFLIPTWKNATANMAAEQFYERIVRDRGMPIELVSDRDPKFTSNFWRTLWKNSGTHLKLSTSRHQSTDGQSEIAIRIVEEILRSQINYAQDNWVKQLASIEFALNNTTSTATGLTPFKIETGRDPNVPLDLSRSLGSTKHGKRERDSNASPAYKMLEDITAAQQLARDNIELANSNMSKYADERRRKGDDIKIGDRVYLKLEGIELDIFKKRPCKKLNPLWFGPLEVLKKISPVSYKLALPVNSNIHDVFHVDRLKSCKTSEQHIKSRAKPLPAIDEPVYEVSKIIDEKLVRGVKKYLVAWKGYSELFDSTWLDIDDLGDANEVVALWKRKQQHTK